jgi:hypothetical protein
MSGIVSRWPVLQRRAVGATDLDANGAVRAQIALEWIEAACDVYLKGCTLLVTQAAPDDLAIERAEITLPPGALSGKPTELAISVGVSEFFPTAFTMTVRVRPFGGDDDRAVNLSRDVSIVDRLTGAAQPLGRDVRDELIAHAHTAEHFN